MSTFKLHLPDFINYNPIFQAQSFCHKNAHHTARVFFKATPTSLVQITFYWNKISCRWTFRCCTTQRFCQKWRIFHKLRFKRIRSCICMFQIKDQFKRVVVKIKLFVVFKWNWDEVLQSSVKPEKRWINAWSVVRHSDKIPCLFIRKSCKSRLWFYNLVL